MRVVAVIYSLKKYIVSTHRQIRRKYGQRSAIDKSTDNNVNDKKTAQVSCPRDHKVIGRLKCLQTTVLTFFRYLP